MNSRMAGTGSSSEDTGRQMRAASRVPSDSGIQTCSSSRTSCGRDVTSRIGALLLAGLGEVERQFLHAAVELRLQLLLVVRSDVDGGDGVAVAVLLAHLGEALPVAGQNLHVTPGIAPFQLGDLLVGRRVPYDRVGEAPHIPLGGHVVRAPAVGQVGALAQG